MQPTAGNGRVIGGRYRLGASLGRGGMAEVFDGYDERLARPVAVKVLRPDQSADQGTRDRFEREARAAAGLSHPSVVAVYDSGEDGGDAFLVMERLPGETLADRIRTGPVPPAWLTAVALDVLSALAAAHARGIVHRDIKPANILIGADGRAKVADFGIAKAFVDDHGMPSDATRAMPAYGEDLTATGMVLGTVAYLAPEQIDGSAASPRSDLYSLGVVLWEALAGRKPYAGDTPVAQARAAASGGAPDIATVRPDVPPGLAAVVRRAMRRDPAERYPSAAAMRADLERAGAGDATRVAPVAPTAVLPTPPRAPLPPPMAPPVAVLPERHGSGWKVLIALLVVAVIAAAVAVVVLTERKDRQRGAVATTTTTAKPTTTTTVKPTTTTTAAPTTTVDVEAAALRRDAAQFAALGMSGTDAVASLLRQVAATPAGGERSQEADGAGESLASLYDSGAITAAQYQQAVSELATVPYFKQSTTTSTTTTPSTPTTPAKPGTSGTTGTSGNSGTAGGSGNTGAGNSGPGPGHSHGPP